MAVQLEGLAFVPGAHTIVEDWLGSLTKHGWIWWWRVVTWFQYLELRRQFHHIPAEDAALQSGHLRLILARAGTFSKGPPFTPRFDHTDVISRSHDLKNALQAVDRELKLYLCAIEAGKLGDWSSIHDPREDYALHCLEVMLVLARCELACDSAWADVPDDRVPSGITTSGLADIVNPLQTAPPDSSSVTPRAHLSGAPSKHY
jgi:hypothetical protein